MIRGEEPLSINSRPVVDGHASWGRGFFGNRTIHVTGYIDSYGQTHAFYEAITVTIETELKIECE